jgi:leader peptidase (prepilin peptidase)/N-methyltransferase
VTIGSLAYFLQLSYFAGVWDLVALPVLFSGLAGAALGAVMGSFIGALVLRWPAGRSVIMGRSVCDACDATLRVWELVPVLSYCVLGGRCARCGDMIGRQQLYAELGGLVIGAAAMTLAPGWPGLAGALFGWALLALGMLDAGHFWLPDRIALPLAATGLVLGLGDGVDRVIGAGAGWLALALIGFTYRRMRGREGLGGGDAKLFAAIGAWLGWQALPAVLLAAGLMGLAWALALHVQGRAVSAVTRLPLGTMLALAAFPFWLAHV